MSNHIKIHGVIPRIQYTADGNLTTFTFPFAIFSTDDVEVYLNDTKQSSDQYSVSGTGESDGGSITFNAAPTANVKVTIVRNLSIERTSDFQEGGALRADTLNDELDYQIACQQQIAENLNRSMVLPPYATDSDLDLTLPTPSAGKAIVWNADGTNLENSTVSINALESTLKGYKESAESAASTATTKAGIASDKADIATTQAQTATTQAGIATAKATEVSEALSTKVNTAMDNITTTGKEAIVSLGMPDYTRGVTFNENTAVQAPYDCVVFWNTGSSQNNPKYFMISQTGAFTTEHLKFPFYANLDGYTDQRFYIPKGVWFKTSGNFESGTTFSPSQYFPLKGV